MQVEVSKKASKQILKLGLSKQFGLNIEKLSYGASWPYRTKAAITPHLLYIIVGQTIITSWYESENFLLPQNRPFFDVLEPTPAVLTAFLQRSASAEWQKGNTTSQMGSGHPFGSVGPMSASHVHNCVSINGI